MTKGTTNATNKVAATRNTKGSAKSNANGKSAKRVQGSTQAVRRTRNTANRAGSKSVDNTHNPSTKPRRTSTKTLQERKRDAVKLHTKNIDTSNYSAVSHSTSSTWRATIPVEQDDDTWTRADKVIVASTAASLVALGVLLTLAAQALWS